MVEQTPAEQKNVSPLMTIVCTRRGKYNLGRTYISLTGFLSLISGQKDCLTSLRCLNLASLGQTTAPLCQTSVLPPYDLGKEKSCRGKISSSSFVFLSCTHVCHLAGIYILPPKAYQSFFCRQNYTFIRYSKSNVTGYINK